MKTKIKPNDILVCHTTCFLEKDITRPVTTIGKKYNIFKINSKWITIIDDINNEHRFTIFEDYNLQNYKTWFITLTEYRKQKLQKIQNEL